MRPPALGKVIGSAVEIQAGSMVSELDRRSTPAGARVSGSSATTIRVSVGDPASATMPEGPTRSASSSVNGCSTSPARRPGATWKIRSRPRARPTAAIEPSGRKPYDERPKTQAGSANSTSSGASGSSRGPSTNR